MNENGEDEKAVVGVEEAVGFVEKEKRGEGAEEEKRGEEEEEENNEEAEKPVPAIVVD